VIHHQNAFFARGPRGKGATTALDGTPATTQRLIVGWAALTHQEARFENCRVEGAAELVSAWR